MVRQRSIKSVSAKRIKDFIFGFLKNPVPNELIAITIRRIKSNEQAILMLDFTLSLWTKSRCQDSGIKMERELLVTDGPLIIIEMFA
jgi:hypothetical protein